MPVSLRSLQSQISPKIKLNQQPRASGNSLIQTSLEIQTDSLSQTDCFDEEEKLRQRCAISPLSRIIEKYLISVRLKETKENG